MIDLILSTWLKPPDAMIVVMRISATPSLKENNHVVSMDETLPKVNMYTRYTSVYRYTVVIFPTTSGGSDL